MYVCLCILSTKQCHAHDATYIIKSCAYMLEPNAVTTFKLFPLKYNTGSFRFSLDLELYFIISTSTPHQLYINCPILSKRQAVIIFLITFPFYIGKYQNVQFHIWHSAIAIKLNFIHARSMRLIISKIQLTLFTHFCIFTHSQSIKLTRA